MIICLPLTFAGESTTPMPESTRLVCKGSSNGLTTYYAPHTHPHPIPTHFLDGGKLSPWVVLAAYCLTTHCSLLAHYARGSHLHPLHLPLSPLYLPYISPISPLQSGRTSIRFITARPAQHEAQHAVAACGWQHEQHEWPWGRAALGRHRSAVAASILPTHTSRATSGQGARHQAGHSLQKQGGMQGAMHRALVARGVTDVAVHDLATLELDRELDLRWVALGASVR
jgi:hypothetical protein